MKHGKWYSDGVVREQMDLQFRNKIMSNADAIGTQNEMI